MTELASLDATREVHLSLRGLSCAGCVGRAERALAAVPGVGTVVVNLATTKAQVTYKQGAPVDALTDALEVAGYPAQQVKDDDYRLPNVETGQRLMPVVFAAVLALPLIVIEMGGHIYPPFHDGLTQVFGHTALLWLQFVLATAVLLGPGRVFFATGFRALLRAAPDMNTLVAAGTGAAWSYSVLAIVAPNMFPHGAAQVYFEAIAVVVTLVLLGRWLEARAKGQTGDAIRALLDLQPSFAELIDEAGETRKIASDEVTVGMRLRLRPGARVPVDGIVLSGEGAVDESLLTGEAMPVEKSVGASLAAGSVNGSSVLDFEATRVGQDSTVARIVRMVNNAQGSKLPVQALVDQVTLWFVPVIMGLAVMVALAWLVFGPDPSLSYALVTGVCVLIIACPCAMGLATPISVMVALGRAAQFGVLFRKGDALQRLRNARVMVFDKTGTLTKGKPELVHVSVAQGVDKAEVLSLVAAVEAQSEHPIAHAFLRGLSERTETPLLQADHVRAIPGQGVEALVEGQVISVGSARLMAARGYSIEAFASDVSQWQAAGETILYAAQAGVVVAALSVADVVKPDARAALAALKQAGITPVMLTGDTEKTAQAIAAQLGISQVYADCLPEDKQETLAQLQSEYGVVGFVGDGINDAPALALADVSLAIRGGADVAVETADVILSGQDHGVIGVVRAVEMSRAAMANIRQNLFWAFGYNVVLIPVAAGVLVPFGGPLLSPALGGAAMALSSVFVVSNALRLHRFNPAPLSVDDATG